MADLKVYYEETIQSTDQLFDIDNTRLADLQRMDHLGLRSLLIIKLLSIKRTGIFNER